MVVTQKTLSWALLSLLGILLTACGGGSGTMTLSPEPAPTNNNNASNTSLSGDAFEAMGGSGQVTIAWNTSRTRTDGSCLSTPARYQINVGLASRTYLVSQVVSQSALTCSPVRDSSCGVIERCSYTIRGLSAASWYIAAQSVDNTGRRSGQSNEGVATIF